MVNKKNRHISTSRYLIATRKHNKSVKFGRRLASLCLESSGTAYECCIFVGHHSHTPRLCPLLICISLLLMRTTGLLCASTMYLQSCTMLQTTCMHGIYALGALYSSLLFCLLQYRCFASMPNGMHGPLCNSAGVFPGILKGGLCAI